MASFRRPRGLRYGGGMDPDTSLCLRCGYVIDGISEAGACPECGLPLRESVAAVRVGSAWQQAPGLISHLKAVCGTLAHPLRSWHVVAVDRPSSSALLWANCLAAALIFPGVAMVATAVHHWRAAPLAVAASVIWFVLLLVLCWIEAIGVRFFGRLRKFRITADVAYAIVGHATAGWIVGAIAGMATAVVMRASGNVAETMRGLATGALVAAGGGLLVFEALTYVGMRRMKYANRPRRTAVDVSAGSA